LTIASVTIAALHLIPYGNRNAFILLYLNRNLGLDEVKKMPFIQDKIISPEIRCFQNVTNYSSTEDPSFHWSIDYEEEIYPVENSSNIYFILESANHEAFSHWVYESSVWLPQYIELKKTFPSCSLIIEKWKDFKKLFFKKYSISEENIQLRSQLPSTNFCFFHTYTSLNDKNMPTIFYKNITSYVEFLNIDNTRNKDISILYLPRGTKENLQGPNNRIYNIQNNLKKLVLDLSGVVYETDTTTSLDNQISIVSRANIVILDYGSNLWVNGCFANNSLLLCLNIGWQQHKLFPSLEFLWNYISSQNRITEIFADYTPPTFENDTAVISFDFEQVKNTLFYAKTLFVKSDKTKENYKQG
jgi:hypothetical protein